MIGILKAQAEVLALAGMQMQTRRDKMLPAFAGSLGHYNYARRSPTIRSLQYASVFAIPNYEVLRRPISACKFRSALLLHPSQC